MKYLMYAALMVVAGANNIAMASAKLAEQKQCMQCHAIDQHKIGPSFKAIKAVYKKGVKNPEARLVAVIQDGSDAHLGPMWGKARMPGSSERPPVSDRDAKQLAKWILR